MRWIPTWLIVLYHCFWFYGLRPPLVANVLVGTFMILSGYVTTLLIRAKREPYPLYLFRRWLRLFPVFAICLGLAILLRPFTVGHVELEALRETSETNYFWWHIASHLTLFHGPIGHWLPLSGLAFLPPAWYLSVQWQFYLVAPLLIWGIEEWGLMGIVTIGALSLAPFASPALSWHLRGDYLLIENLALYFGGIALAYWRGAGLFRAAGPLDQISYSTFLVHYPLLATLHGLIPLNGLAPALAALILFLLSIPIVLLASILLYRLIEQPAISLGKRRARNADS